MPEVLVNTSPLQYLFQLGLLDLLPELYGAVTAPEGVRREIEAGRERGVSLPDLSSFPWLQVARVQNVSTLDLVPNLGADILRHGLPLRVRPATHEFCSPEGAGTM
jgi:predicted nucleic acid-binding protein